MLFYSVRKKTSKTKRSEKLERKEVVIVEEEGRNQELDIIQVSETEEDIENFVKENTNKFYKRTLAIEYDTDLDLLYLKSNSLEK